MTTRGVCVCVCAIMLEDMHTQLCVSTRTVYLVYIQACINTQYSLAHRHTHTSRRTNTRFHPHTHACIHPFLISWGTIITCVCLCMYIFLCAYTYIYIHIHTYTYLTYIHISHSHTDFPSDAPTVLQVQRQVYMLQTCVRVNIYVRVTIHVCGCIYPYIHIYAYIYSSIHTYIHE
jgi:hypothetical protein